MNSTNYYRVEFTIPGSNASEIAWISPQGGLERVDLPGNVTYTGSLAQFYSQRFTAAFSSIAALSNNATLLSGLQKIRNSVESVGQTQMDIATYGLPQPTKIYSNFTVKVGTISGISVRMVVYYFQLGPNGSNYILQVVGLTRV
jgi:hypothetical protein